MDYARGMGPSLIDTWIAGVNRGLAGVPDADAVVMRIRARFVEVLDLVHAVEVGRRHERVAAVDSLVRLTGEPTPELTDVAVAAARAGIRDAGATLGWPSRYQVEVERRTLDSLVDLDRRLEAAEIAFEVPAQP